MSGAVWRLSWARHGARPRRLLWSVAVPVLLLAPVAASPAPAPHRTAVYVIFVVFFGLFGGAVPLIREGERGWIRRVLLTGCGVRRWILGRSAAHALQDVLQLTPALAAVVWLEGAAGRPGLVAATALAVAAALAAANLLGALAAAAVRSLAEGALACAAVGLAAVHLTGAFRAPSGGWSALAAAASPFRPLLETLRGVAAAAGSGAAPPAAGVPAAPAWVAAAVSLAALAALAWTLAPRIAGRLGGEGGAF